MGEIVGLWWCGVCRTQMSLAGWVVLLRLRKPGSSKCSAGKVSKADATAEDSASMPQTPACSDVVSEHS